MTAQRSDLMTPKASDSLPARRQLPAEYPRLASFSMPYAPCQLSSRRGTSISSFESHALGMKGVVDQQRNNHSGSFAAG